MKFLHFFMCTLLLSNTQSITGAQAARTSHELTPTEKSCFAWYEATSKLEHFPSILQLLSAEDMAVYATKLKYTEFPTQVTRTAHNFVDIFFAEAKKANIKLEHDIDTLKIAMLKMVQAKQSKNAEKPTDLLTARTYVLSTLLTPEEQTMWAKWTTNQKDVEQVTAKWSHLVAEELAKLNLIANTPEAKSEKAAVLYTEKITQLKKNWVQSTKEL